MSNRVNIRHWHSTYNDWLRALDFYKNEIAILTGRLTEIAGKNTGHDVAVQIEHFQNAFLLHCNNIDELKHSIHSGLEKVAQETMAQTGFVSNDLLAQLEREKWYFLEEEKTINELRHAFNLFCAEWM